MKKKDNTIFFGLFFLASILVETYCFLQYSQNFVIIAGIGVVILISAYLLFDSLRGMYISNAEEKRQENDERYQKLHSLIEEKMKNLETLEKAVYVVTKRNINTLEEGLNQEEESRKDKIKQLEDTILKSAKLIAKYNREDIRNLSAVFKQETLDSTHSIDQKIAEIVSQLEDMNISGKNNSGTMDVAKITDCFNYNYDGMKLKVEGGFELIEGNLSEIRDTLVNIQEQMKKAESTYHNIQQPPIANHDLELLGNREQNIPEQGRSTNEDVIKRVISDEAITKNNPIEEITEKETDKTMSQDIEVMEEFLEVPNVNKDQPDADMEADLSLEDSVLTINQPANEEETDPDLKLDLEFSDRVNKDINNDPEKITDNKKEEINNELDNKSQDDPNKMMTPEDIAKLISGLSEEKEAEPVNDSVNTAEEHIDPNRSLTPEEIAAMIEGMSSEAAVSKEKSEDISNGDLSDKDEMEYIELNTGDPNKQMSPEEIANLLAAVESGKIVPKIDISENPEPVDEVKDQNKQMSPEEIAELIASMGN